MRTYAIEHSEEILVRYCRSRALIGAIDAP